MKGPGRPRPWLLAARRWRNRGRGRSTSIFIRTVQQINGWRNLPQPISARIPARVSVPARVAPYPRLLPLYTPYIPPLHPL